MQTRNQRLVRCLHGWQRKIVCDKVKRSEEFICGLGLFYLDDAMLLLVLGDACGKHLLDNSSDCHVLLPCKGSDLINQLGITDTREVSDFNCGTTVAICDSLFLSTSFVDRLSICIALG